MKRAAGGMKGVLAITGGCRVRCCAIVEDRNDPNGEFVCRNRATVRNEDGNPFCDEHFIACNADEGRRCDADDGAPCPKCVVVYAYWRRLYATTPPEVRALDYADRREIAAKIVEAGR